MATLEQELKLTSTDATELSLPIAGTGARSYAFIIDWHIRFLVAIAWLLGASMLIGAIAGRDLVIDDGLRNIGTLYFYAVLLPAVIIYGLYHPVLEVAMKGRTPGKRAAGVRIVTTRGHTPGAGALLVRNVFRLVDSLPAFYVVGLVSVILTARQVRIGDMAAGTVLVYERKLARGAFEGIAEQAQDGAGLRAREVTDELLARWKSLAPERRTRLALKLLEARGEPLPKLRGHALDVELHARLKKLAGAE